MTTGLGQTYDQIFRQDDDPLTPYDESGLYSAGQNIFGFGEEMSDAFSDMSDRYEGNQEIFKNLKPYDDVVGYGPGQVDRTLLQAAGKKPGDVVQTLTKDSILALLSRKVLKEQGPRPFL